MFKKKRKNGPEEIKITKKNIINLPVESDLLGVC